MKFAKNAITMLKEFERYRGGYPVAAIDLNRVPLIAVIDEPEEHHSGLHKTSRTYYTGDIADRLYKYEALGYEPEELAKKLKRLEELEKKRPGCYTDGTEQIKTASNCKFLDVEDRDLTISELASFVADNNAEVTFDSRDGKLGIHMHRGKFGASHVVTKRDFCAYGPRIFADALNKMLEEIDFRENVDGIFKEW